MKSHKPSAAVSERPLRGLHPDAGRDAASGQPLPQEWQAYLDKIDAQVQREAKASILQRVSHAIIIVFVVVSYALVVTM